MHQPRNLAELIDAQCVAHGDMPVLTFVDVRADGAFAEEQRTFDDLRCNAGRLAAWLQQAGVEPGDRFALMLHNHPEFVEAMIAAALIGATFVPIDPRSVGDKLAYMLNLVESAVVVAGDYALAALSDAAAAFTHTRCVLVVGGEVDRVAAAGLTIARYDADLPPPGTPFTTAAPSPEAAMFMMFTSGTTGHPKAVVRTHAAHMAGLKGHAVLGVAASDTLYTGLPLSHINAQTTLGLGLSMPQRVVISRRFTKSRLWDICRAYGCTVFTLLGGMIPEVYALPETPDDANNPVRLIISAGMPAHLWDAYRRRFGVEITEIYGSTEGGGVLINRMGEGPVGAMGRPPKGMLAAILDANGAPCPPGQPGELCFRPDGGDPAPVSYFRNDAASRRKVHSGWFRSGDIAHVDADGWFYFHHRAGGGVRRNGDFVNTAVVESVLAKSPVVEDVFVYGVATAATVAGEKMLVAAVVLRDGASAKMLKDWCAGRLQKNEVPEIWQVLPAIPKTISEKPVERECVALLHAQGLVDVSADATIAPVAAARR